MFNFFIGVDQSPNGTAVICLNDKGKINRMLFYADSKKDVKKFMHVGAVESIKVKANDEVGGIKRLNNIRNTLNDFLNLYKNKRCIASMEGYTFARMAFSHSLGEVGGMIRMLFWERQLPYRVYDVQAVKIFATGKGNAKKGEIIEAIAEEYDLHFLKYGKENGAAGNLADAFIIAEMLRTEVMLREGLLELKDLSENKRRVFLRVTKQNFTNVLDLPFIINEEK